MGKNTNQIAAVADLKSLFKDVWYGYSGPTCPKKSQITSRGYTVSGTYATNQCVRWSHIALPSSSSLNVYYGISNRKSSSAKLDEVTVYIGTSQSGPWTYIGSIDPGSVSGTRTGYISCSIPSSVDRSKSLYLRVYCGDTAFKQDWHTVFCPSNQVGTITGGGLHPHSNVKNAATVRALADYYQYGMGASTDSVFCFIIS